MIPLERQEGLIPPTTVAEPYNQADDVFPEETTDSHHIFFVGSIILGLVVVTLILVMVLQATRSSAIEQADARITNLNQQLKTDTYASALKDYTAVQTVIDHMQRLRKNRFLFLPEWEMVKASVPKDVQFITTSLADDATFRITGVTRSMSSVAQFSRALEAQTNSITNVVPLSLDKQSDGSSYSFNLSFEVKRTDDTSKASTE